MDILEEMKEMIKEFDYDDYDDDDDDYDEEDEEQARKYYDEIYNKDDQTPVSKEDFLAYERVRKSGVTNMFMIKDVSLYTGLSKNKIIKIQKNFSEYKKRYLGD